MDPSIREIFSQIFTSHNVIYIMLVTFLLFIILLVFLALKTKKKMQENGEVPARGHYVNRGMTTYMPLGFVISIPIGIMTDNLPIAIALGPAFGFALGIIIGSSKEKKHKQEMRELTESEKKLKKTAQFMLFALFLLGVILFIITFYLVR